MKSILYSNYKEKGREKKTKTKQKQINIKKKSVLF